MSEYYLPSLGGQLDSTSDPFQQSPLLNTYSPRLFGAPPQLSNLCDMRLMSSVDDKPGPVGDFYLQDILKDSMVANFVVGRALFTGGMPTFGEFLRTSLNYAKAISKYNIYGANDQKLDTSSSQYIKNTITEEKIKSVMESNTPLHGVDTEYNGEKVTQLDLSNPDYGDNAELEDSLSGMFGEAAAAIAAPLLTSMTVNQPFYTFDSDWFTYINNVKMMINTGVIMLGLQKACVRIGDQYLPIGMNASVTKDTDVWSNYRYITSNKNLGMVTGIDTLLGDTSQYVSFMLEPNGVSENYQNNSSTSQIYANVINKGAGIGNEIAFITGSSMNSVDDAVLKITGSAINVAESVMSNMTLGAGKFTAALAGSMARSFIGDHTIYPEVYTGSSSTTSMSLKTKLVARSGDPYSFLIDIWVPMCFALGMVLPQMTKNNAASYAYPPLIQCTVPGSWGTRLGLITDLNITKNNDGKSLSVHGFPTSVEITFNIKDLQHVMVSSGMNDPSRFINNNTMFDYIAQTCGCDKYKVNGAVRMVSKLALTASAVNNTFYTMGSTMLTDATSLINKKTGTGRM